MNYNERIDDNFLRADHVDGEVLQHTDLNELENVVKTAINANYEDIQKLEDGSIQTGNAASLNGATLSTYSEGPLQNSDAKIPTSMQIKQYVDTSISLIDLSGYATERELTNAINTYDSNNNGIVDNAERVNNHTVGSDVPEGAKFTDTVYDDTDVRNLANNNASEINSLKSNKLDKNTFNTTMENYYTKTQTDDLLDNKASVNSLNNLVNTVNTGLNNRYTKGETDTLLDEKADISDVPTKVSELENDSNYVRNTDYAMPNKGGVIKPNAGLSVDNSGLASADTYSYNDYLARNNNSFVGKGTLENVIKGKELINKPTLDNSQQEQNEVISTLETKLNETQQELDRYKLLENALPHITGEGTSITLDNTAEAGMKLELGTSELKQDGEPSPSTPYDIHTISGDNEVKVYTDVGEHQEQVKLLNLPVENLINPDGLSNIINGLTFVNNGDETFTISGTSTAETGIRISNSRPILSANIPYTQVVETISGIQQGSIVPSFKGKDEVIKYNYFINNETKIPTEKMTCTSYNYYIAEVGVQVNWTFRVTLAKGKKISYSPFGQKPIELGKMPNTNYENKFVKPSGNNELNLSNLKSATKNGIDLTKNDNGTLTLNGTATADANFAFPIEKIKANANYKVQLYKLNGRFTGNYVSIYLSEDSAFSSFDLLSMTTGDMVSMSLKSKTYTYAQIKVNKGVVCNNLVVGCQIVNNANIVEYEPYNNGKWYLKKEIGKLEITPDIIGNAYYNELTNSKEARIFNKSIYNIKPGYIQMQSNRYSFSKSGTWGNDKVGIFGNAGANNYDVAFRIPVNEDKTYFSTYPTTLYYPLATPEYILVNDTLQTQLEDIHQTLLSYKGQTNITQVNNDLPFNFIASAIKDLSSIDVPTTSIEEPVVEQNSLDTKEEVE